MSTLKMLAGLATAAVLSITTASAGTVSFADFADDNEQGVSYASIVNISGVSLAVRGYGYRNGSYTAYYGYFDDAGDGVGGLGLCRSVDANKQCLDQHTTAIDGASGTREAVKLTFLDAPFDIHGISFRDGQGNLLNDDAEGQLIWNVVDSDGTIYRGTDTFSDYVNMVVAGEFTQVVSLAFMYFDTEFFVESIEAPLPAALPLLLSGIAGLGFATRRKRKAA